ncbi:MAG: hypothetical protein F7B61_06625 [Caldisphaeraceae archaeon]|nr:hypothetical protein [Caldisphaeraceae archaeon]
MSENKKQLLNPRLNRRTMLAAMNKIHEMMPPYTLTKISDALGVADSTFEPYFDLLKTFGFTRVVLDYSRRALGLKVVVAIVNGKRLESAPLKEYWLLGRFYTSIGTVLHYYLPAEDEEPLERLRNELKDAKIYVFDETYITKPNWLYYYDKDKDKLYDIDVIYKMLDDHPPIDVSDKEPTRKPDATDIIIIAFLGDNALRNYDMLLDAFKGPSPLRRMKPIVSFKAHMKHVIQFARGGRFLPLVKLNSFLLRYNEFMPFTAGYVLLKGSKKDVRDIFRRLMTFPFVGQISVGEDAIYFNYVIDVRYFDFTIVREYMNYKWDEVTYFSLLGRDIAERYVIPFKEYDPVSKSWVTKSDFPLGAKAKEKLDEFERWYNAYYSKKFSKNENNKTKK